MRTRIAAQHGPALPPKFEAKILAAPDAEWENVGLIGRAQSAGFNAYALASEAHQAMDQWGTDEAKIFRALAGLTPLQAAALRKCYRAEFGGDLDADLRSELGGAELTRAEALLEGDQALADVAALREAISGAGTDEATIMQVLRGKSEEERRRIIEIYRQQYGDDLNEDLEDDLSEHDLDRAQALMAGDTSRADAIAVDQAMHGGLFGAGTEEADIEAVYTQIRGDVEREAAAKGWTTAEMEAEIHRRHGQVESAYGTKYGAGAEDTEAMRAAFRDELSGSELDLALALADNDLVKADAARLEIERTGFITDDDAVNNLLRSQAERARREVERDLNLDLNDRAEIAALRGRPWDRADCERERARQPRAHRFRVRGAGPHLHGRPRGESTTRPTAAGGRPARHDRLQHVGDRAGPGLRPAQPGRHPHSRATGLLRHRGRRHRREGA